MLSQQNSKNILLHYQKRSDEILKQMAVVVEAAKQKVDQETYNKLLDRLQKKYE